MWCRASVSSRFVTANRGFLWPGLTVRIQSDRSALGVRRHALTAGASVLALVVAFAYASPAAAKIRHEPKEPEHTAKAPFGELPKGPLQIVVSINQQKLHLYADGKEVAQTSVATGVPSLPTPTGVFSVIQKQKFHRSNIYSGAPMPFMQRITWSGVAIHEGENIGHPASHGCIRMPHDFAVKLYDTTKMGVRVMIAREELKPVPFADPHLFVHKDAPPPAPPVAPASTSAEPTPPPASTASTAAAPVPATAPVPPAATPAPGAAESTPAQAEATKTAQNVENKTTDATAPAKPDTQPAAPAGAPSSASAAWLQAGAPDAAPAAAADESGKPVVASDSPAVELRGSVSASTPLDQPEQAAPPAPPPPAPTTLVETSPATHGPIAVFISRKEKKIYVRQNFTPLFYAPVTFTDPDRPVGTTVFTAMDYLDGSTFRWNVVSFPADRPKVKRVAETERRPARRGRAEEPVKAAPGEQPPPQTPAQVLARIDVPQDVIERISELMVPGSSLVVSDQGLGDETGEGTDFIVVTRE
jgi:L,D-transpeptidase catalytic domain